MYKFDITSKRYLEKVHRDLQLIHNTAIKNIPILYGISEGARTWNQQLAHFESGISKWDPRIKIQEELAKQLLTLYRPYSLGTHIYIDNKYITRDIIKNSFYISYIISHLIATAEQLYLYKKIGYKLKWANDTPEDISGILQINKDYVASSYVELYKPK